PTPTPACAPGQQYINGRCQCLGNTVFENGRCVPVTTPPSIPSCTGGQQYINGRCQCAGGYQFQNGRCLPPTTVPTTTACGPGQQYVNGRCQCLGNTIFENGRCVPVTPPTPIPSCGPSQQYINGRCQCTGNTIFDNGVCIPVTTPPSCGVGQQYINGRCQCVGNTVFENGRCAPVTRPPIRPTCPPNTQFYNGRCIPTQPVGPGGYIYEKPDEPFDSSNTISVNLKPTTSPPNTYIPPVTDSTGSTFKNNYITPDESSNFNVVSKLTTPPPQYVGGCAAALKCVQEICCTAEGFISPVPVVITKKQLKTRVPLANCTILDTASEGKCCRDPNYKDPWPSANLVNGVDNGQYKEDNALGKYTPDKPRLVRSGVYPGGRKKADEQSLCGVRNYNTQPTGNAASDMNFAEIPWQAMILRDSSRTLLCGGAIISPNAVLTTAKCVDGIESRDILVKGGEWKLGVDEEPQPFQIVKVAAVARHPNYRIGNLTNDLAILVLREKLRPTGNVGSVCLQSDGEVRTEKCIVTGWGKEVLQVHLKNALMHGLDVKILQGDECREKLQSTSQESLPNLGSNTICSSAESDLCKVKSYNS
ncbi:Trypsin, partial [Oryctes borbonicus]